MDEYDDDEAGQKERKREDAITQQNTIQNESTISDPNPSYILQVRCYNAYVQISLTLILIDFSANVTLVWHYWLMLNNMIRKSYYNLYLFCLHNFGYCLFLLD